jgi:hypothetical protein
MHGGRGEALTRDGEMEEEMNKGNKEEVMWEHRQQQASVEAEDNRDERHHIFGTC